MKTPNRKKVSGDRSVSSAVQRDSAQQKKSENITSLLTEAYEYQKNRQFEQASFLYQQVVEIDPENIIALNGLGIIAKDTGMISLALDFFRAAYSVNPDNVTVNRNLGVLYARLSVYDRAIHHYQAILKADRDNAEAHGEIARLYLHTGDTEKALHHYKCAFRLNPEDPRNFHGLVQLDPQSVSDEQIKTIEAYLNKPDLPLNTRCSFYFALGTIYDRRGKYDEAFANYTVANLSKGLGFDSNRHADLISQIIDNFPAELFDEPALMSLNNSQQPVFIVGMPRSGSTLVEQILSTHSDVYAAGELNLIDSVIGQINNTHGKRSADPVSLDSSDADLLKNLSRFYLNGINNLAQKDGKSSAARITDKMPENYLHLGLIALLFPNASIIHCERNPLDVSLSCYFQNFAGNHSYATDLKNIALYYQQYERLMQHWKQVLPVRIHTIRYEDMILDTESVSRQLMAFLDIDWQNNHMKYMSSARPVNTASLVQVRKKIYQSSLDRWKNYEKYLHSLKKILEVPASVYGAMKEVSADFQDRKYPDKTNIYLH